MVNSLTSSWKSCYVFLTLWDWIIIIKLNPLSCSKEIINLLTNKWKWGHIIVPEKSSLETDHFLASPMQHNAQSLHFYPCGSAPQPSHRLQSNVLFGQKERLAEVKSQSNRTSIICVPKCGSLPLAYCIY